MSEDPGKKMGWKGEFRLAPEVGVWGPYNWTEQNGGKREHSYPKEVRATMVVVEVESLVGKWSGFAVSSKDMEMA